MINVSVYLISPMTGYDRPEMVARAKYMVALGAEYGVRVISPVIVEKVGGSGVLVQNDELELSRFWKHDKEIIRNRDGNGSHVCLWDRADRKSVGGEREFGLNRYALFKPTLCLVPRRGITVANYEDDGIFTDEREAFKYIAEHYGTQLCRAKWRIKMLVRSLPGWILDQIAAFR